MINKAKKKLDNEGGKTRRSARIHRGGGFEGRIVVVLGQGLHEKIWGDQTQATRRSMKSDAPGWVSLVRKKILSWGKSDGWKILSVKMLTPLILNSVFYG